MTERPSKRPKRETSPPAPYSPGDMVTLLVGKEHVKLLIPGPLITRDSDFFDDALKKEWTQSQTRVIKLPEDCPVTIKYYLDFVCDLGLPTRTLVNYADIYDSDTMYHENMDGYGVLARLYTLGERVLNTPLRNAIIKEIVRLNRVEDDGICTMPDADAVSEIYGGTPSSSPIRGLMVDLWLSEGTEGELDDYDLDATFLRDLVCAFMAKCSQHVSFAEFRWRKVKAENYLIIE